MIVVFSDHTLLLFVYKYVGANCSLVVLRIITFVLLSFPRFLRINEALKLLRSDIIFYPSRCSFSIRNSKTDVYRLGNSLATARTGILFCPLHLLERYLLAANINDNEYDEYMFLLLCMEVHRSYKTET